MKTCCCCFSQRCISVVALRCDATACCVAWMCRVRVKKKTPCIFVQLLWENIVRKLCKLYFKVCTIYVMKNVLASLVLTEFLPIVGKWTGAAWKHIHSDYVIISCPSLLLLLQNSALHMRGSSSCCNDNPFTWHMFVSFIIGLPKTPTYTWLL